jgi:nitrite reductase/ring-hydroxylating ferredoxin subunit
VQRLCELSALPEGKGIAVAHAGGTLLLVRSQGELHAYEDRCPHMSLSLRWPPAEFVSPDGQYILCSNHNAIFRVSDGVCVTGPCGGDRLVRRDVTIADGAVWLS